MLETHGPTPAAVQHISQASQYKRFEILSDIDQSMTSVVDVGCGLGDMCDFLLNDGYTGQYLGLDFLDEFIELANKTYAKYPNFKFQTFDLWHDSMPKKYDYMLLSGVFNNKFADNRKFMRQSIDKMFAASRKGIAFNAISTYVDYQADNLYYSDPLEVFDYCKKNLTRRVVLKHDYVLKKGSIPFEYTIYLYKNAS